MDILDWDDATPLYNNAADDQWIMDQLQHDIMQHSYNVWSK